jgi:hypothetical protein
MSMDIEQNEILTNKKVLLASPGYKLNDAYYSNADSVVEMAETTYSTGRFSYSLQSSTFGSSSSIIIPNSSLIGEIYLHAELPIIPFNSNLKLNRGWLLDSINSISFLFGSSNVPQLTFSGQSLFQILMAECETAEKRNAVLEYAGQSAAATNSVTPPALPTLYVKNWADLVLSLPFSSMCGLCSKKPFDSNILSNNIIVQINWNQASAIYSGIGPELINTPPAGFTDCKALLRQGDFSNKAESLRNALQLNPGKSLNYPFIHHQSYTPSFFNGAPASTTPGGVTLSLQGLINADLVAMTFGVVKTANLIEGRSKHYEDITNIKLLYNGMVICDMPKYMYKLVNMGGGGIGDLSYNVVFPPGVTPGPNPPQRHVVLINFSRLKSLSFNNHFANTARYPNSTFQLSFNTEEGTAGEQYVCFVTYHYNGICMVENGQANLHFD